MVYDNQKLLAALSDLQIIDPVQLAQSATEAQTQGLLVGDILLDKNLITEEDLGKLVADVVGVPFIHLSAAAIPKEILTIIPEIIARQQQLVSFKKDARGLHVAMTNPLNKEMISFLQNKLNIVIIPYLATSHDVSNALSQYMKDIGKAFEDIITESLEAAKKNKGNEMEPPIIKIVETIISYAFENNASDIHLEPEQSYSLVRFRIDGVLHDIIRLELEIYPQIVTRIKVLAKLRTDEHQLPQDGKIEHTMDGEALDIRISVVPVRHGEKIVMRLLSEHARKISLQSLGFSPYDMEKVKRAYTKPYGMILSTGPTGSGKTTTMYAVLKLLNNRDVNIMTIEDPIEYELEGINQMQVNEKAQLTFATGLRSILRQDPNIILVGEIRDKETADIGVSAAMTGHLVLSTLHTNDASTAIPRFIEMGVEPFLVASTVNVIIAQRLLRKIHMVCRVSEEIPRENMLKYIAAPYIDKIFGAAATIRLYRGKGCNLCHNTGYESRMGVFEVLEMNEELEQAVIEKKDTTVIRNIAVKNGMKTMLEDGLEKIKNGDTTLEELLRVTKEE